MLGGQHFRDINFLVFNDSIEQLTKIVHMSDGKIDSIGTHPFLGQWFEKLSRSLTRLSFRDDSLPS